MSIPHRYLGKGGPLVPAIGLGCMDMSSSFVYGPHDENESVKALHRAIELGCTFWDTADIYPNNEEFLSTTLVPNRNKIFICTKFGIDGKVEGGVNGKREYARQQCEASLKKLGIDQIDLYYLHRVDTNTPIEETVAAMAELVKEGKVKYLGLSECSAATLRKAYTVHPIAAVQVEYSPWCLDIETNGLLAACRELGVAIVAYSPLSRGFLTGQIKTIDDLAPNDWRRNVPRFQGENFQKNVDIVKEFEALAKQKGIATAQLVLAWILYQGEDFILIPGTKRVKYLEENVGAANVKVTEEDNAAIRKIIATLPVSGDRYPAGGMTSLNK